MNNIEDNIELDADELVKQNREDILKKGKYAEVRIVIESGKDNCIPSIELNDVGLKDISFMIASLEEIVRNLKKEFPMADMLTKFGSITSQKF